MKYIKLFEEFTKNYMKKIDLKDFKKIKKGAKLMYMGSKVEVLDNDGYVLKLKGEDGRVFMANKSQFDHSGMIGEIKSSMISGTSGRTIDSLENRKYKLKKDAKGATIGSFSNVTLPKGTIIYNLPGGLFADHFSLKSKYTTPRGDGPKWLSQSWGQGVSIRRTPALLSYIEKNSKVLESFDTEVNEDISQKLNNKLGDMRGAFSEEDIKADKAEFWDIKPGKYVKFYIEDVNDSAILKVKRIAKANGLKFAKDLEDILLFTESVNESKNIKITLTGDKATEVDFFEKYSRFFDGPNVYDYLIIPHGEKYITCKPNKLKSCENYLKKNNIEYKIQESVVNEAKAYKLKASEFGSNTFSAAYNVKGEPAWRVHSTYAIDQVSGENNPEERDAVFFEAMPIKNEIYIKIGGINNLKRTGATVGNNFSTTIEEWKKDPKGIAKEASKFLTDATHLKWINKKARSQGQTIKWALKDDYSSVIEDLVNKSLGLNESSAKDGGDKSNGNSHHEDHKSNSIAQHWKDTYGEDFHSKYPAIAKIVKSRPGLDKRELKRIWDETYGENFEEQYPALWQKMD